MSIRSANCHFEKLCDKKSQDFRFYVVIVSIFVSQGLFAENPSDAWFEKAKESLTKPSKGESSIMKTQEKKIDAQDSLGRSALHRAALEGDLSEVKKMVADGATVDNESAVGTPLYYAVDEGHFEVVEFLVKNGANVNSPNGIGDLPLDTAISNLQNVFTEEDKAKYKKVIDFLKSKGAKTK